MSGATSLNQCSILSTKMPVICCQLRSIHSNSSKYRLKKVGTRGSCARQIRRLPAIINMTTTTTEAAADDDGVERRRGVFHPNLWDDDFIQSLTTTYHGQSSYSERAERLIGEVKEMFHSISMGDGRAQLISPSAYDTAWGARVTAIDGSSRPQIPQTIDWLLLNQLQDGSWGSQSHLPLFDRPVNTLARVVTLATWKIGSEQIDQEPRICSMDIFQRLWMVDTIECLGIDRHFKSEIQVSLDYVYSYWNEKGIGCSRESIIPDLNSTSLALRTLRLHGYNVSSAALEHFKDQSGQFVRSSIQTVGEIRSVLNLFRASLLAFPGEKVMEEAETFARRYLKEMLQKIPPSSLSREIEYVLEFGWQSTIPRWEARSYIEIHEQATDNPWSIYEMQREKLMELAKLEFNILNSLQHIELQRISRWWKDSGLSQMSFTRHRPVEYYTMASCIVMEPKHSAFRLGFAKLCEIATCLDDIYDTYGTIDELELFTAAVKRWDPSTIECLPAYMKSVYMLLYQLVSEMARDTEETQGRDTLEYARKAWEAIIDAHMEEARWISSGYIPTFEEYLKNSKITSGLHIAILPILTMDIPLPDDLSLQEIDIPSRFHHLASSIGRLRGDMNAYKCMQIDRAHGEEASCISCYMKDNPGTTEEDALNHFNAMNSFMMKELNWELLGPGSNIPFSITCKKPAFDIYRASNYMYKYRDGYTIADKETKNLVMRTLVQPVAL